MSKRISTANAARIRAGIEAAKKHLDQLDKAIRDNIDIREVVNSARPTMPTTMLGGKAYLRTLETYRRKLDKRQSTKPFIRKGFHGE